MRAVNAYGRWFWGLSGLATAMALTLPGVKFFVHFGQPIGPPAMHTVSRTLTVSQHVTSVTVDTQGVPLRIVTRPVPRVEITEQVTYSGRRSQAHAVKPWVSHGQLTLSDAPVATWPDEPPDDGCCVASYLLVVPPKMSVSATTEGGSVSVSGTAATTVDSNGGPVVVSRIAGPLSIHSEGGDVSVSGLNGQFRVDSGGGPLFATGIRTTYLDAVTEGGNLSLWLDTPPQTIVADTGGGNATLWVPGGPYALTADSGGGPQTLQIMTSSTATHSITVSTESGLLAIRTPDQAAK